MLLVQNLILFVLYKNELEKIHREKKKYRLLGRNRIIIGVQQACTCSRRCVKVIRSLTWRSGRCTANSGDEEKRGRLQRYEGYLHKADLPLTRVKYRFKLLILRVHQNCMLKFGNSRYTQFETVHLIHQPHIIGL